MSEQNRYKEECSNMNFTERRILFSLCCLISHIVLYSNSYQDACNVINTEFTIAYRNYLPYNGISKSLESALEALCYEEEYDIFRQPNAYPEYPPPFLANIEALPPGIYFARMVSQLVKSYQGLSFLPMRQFAVLGAYYNLTKEWERREEDKIIGLGCIYEISSCHWVYFCKVFALTERLTLLEFEPLLRYLLNERKELVVLKKMIHSFTQFTSIEALGLLTGKAENMPEIAMIVGEDNHTDNELINFLQKRGEATKALAYIKAKHLPPASYPQIISECTLKSLYFFAGDCLNYPKINTITLSKTISLMNNYPLIIQTLTQELINKGYPDRALELLEVTNTDFPCENIYTGKNVLNIYTKEFLKGMSPKTPNPKETRDIDIFGPISPNCFRMPCAIQDVKFISTPQDLPLAVPLLEEEFIGLDSEWRPAILDSIISNPLAILQISSLSLHCIFSLHHLKDNPQFNGFIRTLLMDERILKVGQDFITGDLRELVASYPSMAGFRQIRGYLNLPNIYKQVYNTNKCNLAAIYNNVLGNY